MSGSIVQSQSTTTTGSSVAVTLTSTTAGNAIYVVALDGSGTSKALTCADSANHSYGTALDSINDTTNGNTGAHWLKANGAGGTIVVTVTPPSSDFLTLYAAEVAGVTSSPLDGHSANVQATVANGGSVTSGTCTNTATAFVLGVSAQVSSTLTHPTIGAGFTVDPNQASGFWNFGGGNAGIAEYEASVAASTSAALWTNGLGSSETFMSFVVKLDEGSGPPPAIQQQQMMMGAGN